MSFLFTLFSTFFRIGLFTIGGGYAMIPLIEAEVVERRHWADHDELTDLIAVAQSCPGIFAINISIFIGYKLRGKMGALVCCVGTAMPSFLIILCVAMFFSHFRQYTIVERVFRGIRPAVVALILAPVFKMAKSANLNKRNCWIPIAAAVAICCLGISPIYVILFAVASAVAYEFIRED